MASAPRAGLDYAKDTKQKIRTHKKDLDLVIEPVYGHSPAVLLNRIDNAVESADGEVFQIFGAEVKGNLVVIHFDNDSSKRQLVNLLLDQELITTKQIKTNNDLVGDRFLLKDLDPVKYKSKRDSDKLQKQLLKFLEKNKDGVDFANYMLQVVDVDDGLAIVIIRNPDATKFLVEHPNVFINLRRAVAVLYPPGPFCDTCSSLEHTESDCMSSVKCFVCGGPHAGNSCRPYNAACPNCTENPMFKKRTRHSAKSSLCKSMIQHSLTKIGMSL